MFKVLAMHFFFNSLQKSSMGVLLLRNFLVVSDRNLIQDSLNEKIWGGGNIYFVHIT